MLCPLCTGDGGLLVARHPQFRIIRVTGAEAADFPAFYRVVWQVHVSEWTDLPIPERQLMGQAVEMVESTLRQHLQPQKINLASLGNVVPHLHWHIIARYDWDSRWPAPIWAAAQRAANPSQLAAVRDRLPTCDAALAAWVLATENNNSRN